MNLLKCSATNWDPLSVQTCSGSPFRVNMVHSTTIVFSVVVDDILITSGHLEWASMAMRNIESKNGLAKSTWTLCHGEEGHSHGCWGPRWWDVLYLLAPITPLCQLFDVSVDSRPPDICPCEALHLDHPHVSVVEFSQLFCNFGGMTTRTLRYLCTPITALYWRIMPAVMGRPVLAILTQ